MLAILEEDMIALSILLKMENANQKKNAIEILKYSMNSINLTRQCISTHVYTDIDHKNTISYYEFWDNEDSLNRRIKSVQFKDILNVVDTSSLKPEILISNVTNTEGIEFIQSLRKKL